MGRYNLGKFQLPRVIMNSFREYITEEAQKVVKSGWFILKLDSGVELMTNVNLISQNKIQITFEDDVVKTIKLNNKDSFVSQIEEILGQPLNLKSKDTLQFIDLYPCECPVYRK